MLSSSENTRRLFDGTQAERVGLTDQLWGATVEKWTGQGYPTRMVGNEEVPVEDIEHFGFDMAGVGGSYDMMPLRHVHEVIEETDEWQVTRNGAGAALKFWKNKDGTPEHIDFRMTSREIWDRDYRPHLMTIERDRVDVDFSRKALEKWRAKGRWTHYGTLFIWENMRRSLGDLCMYESLITDPLWIHDYNRVHTDHLIGHYRILLEEAGVPDGIWLYEDLGFKERLFCSPKVLAELIFPFYKEVVDFFHSFGMKVVLHSCGFTADALPLIVETGFDALHPMEVAAGNDVFKFAEEYRDDLVFIGGFDKRIIETHDKELIRREVSSFMTRMKERGARFIFGSDHSVSTNTDYDDYRYALDVYREYMMY